MATAKKLPSGSYRVRVYDKTTKKQKSFTAETKKEAELMALEWLNGRASIRKADKTVGECIDEYIDSKRNILSPSTIAEYERTKRNLLAELCDYKLSGLSQTDVQKHINMLAKSKSSKTVRNAHGLLVSAINVYAPDLRLRTTLPKVQKKYKQYPNVEDVVKAVKGTDVELPCLMALWLGMRLSEIRGAKKSSIHNNVLTIENVIITVDRKDIEKSQTKTTESTRRVTLPPYIVALIDRAEGEYLVNISGTAIYKRFIRLLEKNNLPRISFHDLRHLNASAMLSLGVPDKYAMERGGWSSPSVMKSVYQHTFSDERKAVDNKIDSYFQELISND